VPSKKFLAAHYCALQLEASLEEFSLISNKQPHVLHCERRAKENF
jgi:hypothetical protein